MKLNIYEKRKVIKTYTEETYRIEWGVMCDVAEALNLDDMKDGSDGDLLRLGFDLLKRSTQRVNELMLDIFDGLTMEELRHAHADEVVRVLIDVARFTIANLVPDDEKN